MKLCGSEFDLRRFMASNYLQKTHLKQLHQLPSSEGTPSQLHRQIQAIILAEFSQKAYPISEAIVTNLVNHLAIAVMRMQSGRYLDRNLPIGGRTNAEQSLLGKRIVKRIEEECSVLLQNVSETMCLVRSWGNGSFPK